MFKRFHSISAVVFIVRILRKDYNTDKLNKVYIKEYAKLLKH